MDTPPQNSVRCWKTTNGGASWTEILNLGFPYYWYGVTTLSANEVVISGFNDSNFEGIIRWSQDGGTTWTNDIVLTTSGWSFRTRFANANDGLVMDGLALNAPNAAHVTTDGGQTATDWTLVQPVDPNGGWFGNEFSLLSNLHARASGISYCSSTNGGGAWTCGPPVDSVFDGPVFFANDKAGWVGGGEISPNVEGWVHRTTDGGNTWSGRTLDDGWPVRQINFLTAQVGWAAGGNVYTGVGGMYYSADGGQTWTLDISTGAEMSSCDSKHSGKNYQIWCAGYNASFQRGGVHVEGNAVKKKLRISISVLYQGIALANAVKSHPSVAFRRRVSQAEADRLADRCGTSLKPYPDTNLAAHSSPPSSSAFPATLADRRAKDLARLVSSDRIEELLLEPDHHEMRAETVRDHDHSIAAAPARITSVQSEFGVDVFEKRDDGRSNLLAHPPSGQDRG